MPIHRNRSVFNNPARKINTLILLLGLTLLGSLSAHGQFYITPHVDSAKHTSEDLAGTFKVTRGMGGHSWGLRPNRELSFAEMRDQPGFAKDKVVGWWEYSGDSLVFEINKRLDIQMNAQPAKSAPYSRKFRILSLSWTVPAKSKDRFNNPMLCETRVLALIESRETDMVALQEDFRKHLHDKFQRPTAELDSDFDFMGEVEVVRSLAESFFHERKILICVKGYVNGNLLR